jgi:hypothetical protein
MEVQKLEVLQLGKAWVERPIQEVAPELEILQGADLAHHLEAAVRQPVQGLPHVSNADFKKAKRYVPG